MILWGWTLRIVPRVHAAARREWVNEPRLACMVTFLVFMASSLAGDRASGCTTEPSIHPSSRQAVAPMSSGTTGLLSRNAVRVAFAEHFVAAGLDHGIGAAAMS